MNSRQGSIVLAVLLLLLLLGAIWWGFGQRNDKNALLEENDRMESELGDVKMLKAKLEVEVDSLERAYSSLSEENQTLQGSLADAQQTIKNRDASIRKLQQTNKGGQEAKAQLAGLTADIETLMAAKLQLEANIQSLRAENDSLRAITGILEEDLGKARDENAALANLNRSIQEEVDRLTLANFKANGFRVETEKKNAKATAKSRQARRLKVSFDLTDVPTEYQGVRPIYLVISDEKGTPIKLDNPIKAQVTVNGQPTDIIASEAKEVNIAQNQRLSFSHDLAEKLGSGYYRAAVFTDIGLLGASSFRLR